LRVAAAEGAAAQGVALAVLTSGRAVAVERPEDL
jgi:hypothetical protein